MHEEEAPATPPGRRAAASRSGTPPADARRHYREIRAQPLATGVSRVQAERARLEMAETRRPNTAQTLIPYIGHQAARFVMSA